MPTIIGILYVWFSMKKNLIYRHSQHDYDTKLHVSLYKRQPTEMIFFLDKRTNDGAGKSFCDFFFRYVIGP